LSCSFTVGDGPASAIAASGAEFTVSIATTAACAWSASSDSAFITPVGAMSGTGDGTVRFAVQANTGDARQGSVQVANRALTVSQAAAAAPGGPGACIFSVSPASSNVAAAGADVIVDVTVTSGTSCSWTATSNDAFISIKNGQSGTGNGKVTLGVAANSGAARTGSSTIAGQPVVVTQDAVAAPPPPPGQCAFSVAPSQTLVGAAGGAVTFTLTQTQGVNCAWTATSQASFITVTTGSSGVGNGTVVLAVATNPGSQRTGTVTAGGQVFTVFQETDCILSLSQYDYSVPAQGGSVVVNVSFVRGTTCTWNVISRAAFVTLVGGNNTFVGAGSFTLNVAPNLGGARSGSVDVTSTPYAFAVNIHQAANGPAPGTVAVLKYQSDPGDYIGSGLSNTFTLTSSEFTAIIDSAHSELQFGMAWNGTTAWNVVLEAPSGQPLAPALYNQAAGWPIQPFNLPGLRVSGDGHGCDPLNGRFVIAEAVYGPNQTVQRFHAKFEQHCGFASPAIRGELWIDAQGSMIPLPMADLPPGPASPTTFFNYQSDPGDPIGLGGSGSYTIATARFSGADAGGRTRVLAGVSELTGPLFRWSFLFDAGSGQLQTGLYTVTGAAGAPRFDISRFGSTTCVATGKFDVSEILFGPQGELERFHVTFEYRCGGSQTAALRGEIYIVANPWK
jgi:hypothetical protein